MTEQAQRPEPEQTLEQIILAIPTHARPQQLDGLNAVVQIRATGPTPGDWIISVKDRKCTAKQGLAPSPDLALEASSDVWLGVIKRKLDPAWAYMSGQMRVSGDLGLAMRLQSILNLG